MSEAHHIRRPVRQRKTVTHYSDDNPSTFTVKRKKGAGGNVVNNGVDESPSSAPSRAARAEGRSRLQRQRQLQNERQALQEQRRRKDPPASGSNGSGLSGVSRPKRKRQLKEVLRPSLCPPSKDNNSETADVSSRAHAVALQPIFWTDPPSSSGGNTHMPSRQQSHTPQYLNASASKAAVDTSSSIWQSPPPTPAWNRLSEPRLSGTRGPSAFKDASTSLSNHELKKSSAPWTTFSVRTDDPAYFCVGTASGHVLLYWRSRCIQVISSAAVGISGTTNNAGNHFNKRNSRAAVTAAAWLGSIVVVGTQQELEAFRVSPSPNSENPSFELYNAPVKVFGIPLTPPTIALSSPAASNSPAVSGVSKHVAFQTLHLHPDQSLLLWRPGAVHLPNPPTQLSGDGRIPPGSLLCLEYESDLSEQSLESPVRPQLILPENVAIDDFLCYTGIWDEWAPNAEKKDSALDSSISPVMEQDSSDPLILMVAQLQPGSVALLRLNRTGTVFQKTSLSADRVSLYYTDCVLQAYQDYIFLCTGRGIRCYERHRLTFLTVYGETVALHGKTLGWQACFWMPEPFQQQQNRSIPTTSDNSKMDPPSQHVVVSAAGMSGASRKQQCTSWLVRTDELNLREQQKQHAGKPISSSTPHGPSVSLTRAFSGSTQSSSVSEGVSQMLPCVGGNASAQLQHMSNSLFSNMVLVGVPHPTRGPKELQSTLYIWKPGQVLPLTTLQAPNGGLLGLQLLPACAGSGWTLRTATLEFGHGWERQTAIKSDFAGQMYPVNYQLVLDNVEYIEDEDELDTTLLVYVEEEEDKVGKPINGDEIDHDLARALKASLHQTYERPVSPINVLDDPAVDDPMKEECFVPSIPDPIFNLEFQRNDQGSNKNGITASSASSAWDVLEFFPQTADVESDLEELESRAAAARQLSPSPSQTGGRNTTVESDSHGAPPAQMAPVLPAAHNTPANSSLFKAKGKRSRPASIEVMLQSTVDPSLKHQLQLQHKVWSDGLGSTLYVSCMEEAQRNTSNMTVETGGQSDSLLTESKKDAKSFENGGVHGSHQDAARDLLMLIPPTRNGESENVADPSPSNPVVTLDAPYSQEQCTTTAVTPSDLSPSKIDDIGEHEKQSGLACLACAGRWVIHTCGKRDMPVDTEALAREEEERKARLEEELHRQRMEKRRATKAKREEARRKKKELEKQAAVASSTASNYFQRQADLGVRRSGIPTFSELTAYETEVTTSTDKFDEPVVAKPHNFHYSEHDWRPVNGPMSNEMTETDDMVIHEAAVVQRTTPPPVTELTTTLTATDGDALAALAGLAHCMAQTDETSYQYKGSFDRRTAILAEYTSQVANHGDSNYHDQYNNHHGYHHTTGNYDHEAGGMDAHDGMETEPQYHEYGTETGTNTGVFQEYSAPGHPHNSTNS